MRAGFLSDLRQPAFLGVGAGLSGNVVDPDTLRVQQQLQADRVRIVSRDEPPSNAKAPAKPRKQVEKAVEKPVEGGRTGCGRT